MNRQRGALNLMTVLVVLGIIALILVIIVLAHPTISPGK